MDWETRVRANINARLQAWGAQTDLASKITTHKQGWLSRYLSGELEMDLPTLQEICTLWRVSLTEIAEATLPELTPEQVEAAEVAALWPSVPQAFRENVLGLLRALHTSRGSGQTDNPAGAPVKPRTAARERQGGR